MKKMISAIVFTLFMTNVAVFAGDYPSILDTVEKEKKDNTRTKEVIKGPGKLVWKYECKNPLSSSPVVKENIVYVGTADDMFYAIKAGTGEIKWKIPTDPQKRGGGAVISQPLIEGGRIYVGTVGSHVGASLLCLNSEDGKSVWSYSASAAVNTKPALADDVLIFGSDDKCVYGIDAGSGGKVWRYETGDIVRSSPTVNEDIVYVGSNDGFFYALEAEDGKLKWKYETGDAVRSTPLVVEDKVYFGSDDQFMYCLNAGNGKEFWKFETKDAIGSSPVFKKGVIYFGCADRHVYAVDAGTGKLKWKYETDDWIYSTPVIFDSTLYVGSWDENLYAIDVKDGSLKWKFKAGKGIKSSPFAVDESIEIEDSVQKSIFFTSKDGYVYAVLLE